MSGRWISISVTRVPPQAAGGEGVRGHLEVVDDLQRQRHRGPRLSHRDPKGMEWVWTGCGLGVRLRKLWI